MCRGHREALIEQLTCVDGPTPASPADGRPPRRLQGSNIMLPTMHVPEANDVTGEPVEDPVKCVMSTGRSMTLVAEGTCALRPFPAAACSLTRAPTPPRPCWRLLVLLVVLPVPVPLPQVTAPPTTAAEEPPSSCTLHYTHLLLTVPCAAHSCACAGPCAGRSAVGATTGCPSSSILELVLLMPPTSAPQTRTM